MGLCYVIFLSNEGTVISWYVIVHLLQVLFILVSRNSFNIIIIMAKSCSSILGYPNSYVCVSKFLGTRMVCSNSAMRHWESRCNEIYYCMNMEQNRNNLRHVVRKKEQNINTFFLHISSNVPTWLFAFAQDWSISSSGTTTATVHG